MKIMQAVKLLKTFDWQTFKDDVGDRCAHFKLPDRIVQIIFGLGRMSDKPIGTGSTADTIRYEVITGQPVGGKFHAQKGQEYINALNNWIRKHPNASASDHAAAQLMLDDLKDALGGSSK